ncbi:MAG: peroxiredoxin family protein [Chloroflexota bacterium]|nr:peroxiredoxin family protein [Chloroflexota bacterium]
MIFTSSRVPVEEFERVAGWQSKPEGLCRGERCVPFRSADAATVELAAAAEALAMPLVHDRAHGLWALGAEAGGHALRSAVAPELELPDFCGGTFRLSSLRGTKVLLVAWASW